MTTHWRIATAALGLTLVSGCAKSGGDAPPPSEPPTDAPAERPALTSAECEAKGGTIVGDIGDGAIHRPDYRCEGGEPPLGSIKAAEGEPMGVEGSVCCPAAAAAEEPAGEGEEAAE